MSWRTVAAALTVVFAIVLLQSILAGPITSVITDLQDSGDYGDDGPGDFDGEARMDDLLESWFTMGLVGIFGFMAWAFARVVRKERTRNRL